MTARKSLHSGAPFFHRLLRKRAAWSRKIAANSSRKTFFITALAFSLIVALVVAILDEEMREKLGASCHVLALAIIGSVLLLLAG